MRRRQYLVPTEHTRSSPCIDKAWEEEKGAQQRFLAELHFDRELKD